MNKRRIGIGVATLVILACIVLLISMSLKDPTVPIGSIRGYKTSSVEVNVTYQEGSSEIAKEVDFTYDNVKSETSSFKVVLNENTKLSISNYSTSSVCRIIVYDGSSEVWSSELYDDAVFDKLVSNFGTYELVLEMSEGTGYGHIQLT